MKMSAKFIHVFAVGLFVLTFMSSFRTSSREGAAIRCEPVYKFKNNSNYFVNFNTIRLKNIIGKNFYDVYDTKGISGEEIFNQNKLMELFPTCTFHDTITILSLRDYRWRGNQQVPYRRYSVVKFNDELFCILYCNDGQYKRYSIAVSGIYKPEICYPSNTDMIMLNVVLEWNSDIIKCMLRSSPFAYSDYGYSDYLAQRFILQDGVITDYQEIKFDEASWWFLSDCYSRDSIPTKYLRDLRYDSPDSLITRYLQGECYEYLYWKHYRQ